MKLANIIVLSLVASATLITGCCTTPTPTAWEYRDEFLSKGESLNSLAKDGWIVVSAYYDTENKSAHYVVKRLKK